jgi:hypothetical protein
MYVKVRKFKKEIVCLQFSQKNNEKNFIVSALASKKRFNKVPLLYLDANADIRGIFCWFWGELKTPKFTDFYLF